LRVLFEKLGESESVGNVSVNSKGESFESLKKEEGCEGVQSGAEVLDEIVS
jgi:hypothetical protein